MRVKQVITRLMTLVACLAWCAGCGEPTATNTRLASNAIGDQQVLESPRGERSHYEAQVNAGRLRIYLKEPIGSARTLVRSVVDSRSRLSEEESRAIVANEVTSASARSWDAGRARLIKVDREPVQAQSAETTLAGAEQHDALLEMAERFDEQLKRDPGHLGMLRDLCVCYARLLVFEKSSALEAAVCLQAARRLSEYEEKAAPMDDADLALVKNIRAWLLFARGIYPRASELLEAGAGGTDAAALRRSLESLRQDQYERLSEFRVGDLQCKVYQARGTSPHPDFLWGESFFVFSPKGDERPEQTRALVLTRCGEGSATKYYLYLRSLVDARMLRLFGRNRPPMQVIRSAVEQIAKSSLAETGKER
jgi:hypothetical protein